MTTQSPEPETDPASHRLDLPFIEKGKKLTGTAREAFAKKVVAAYRNSGRKVTIREICEVTNRSYGAIHSLLSEAGATKRGRRTAGKQEQVTS
ncbi:helix-turn-helix domain-containing protein [Streptomyces rishiriensis]|uniref:helix-turn-helix domain-containing protein n=1 Tax=Streptomyces rishiriensis TaxID=68264 RepID=UPI00378D290A